jgi:anti-sigma regulatory factor (Ser/Thr protein kinase)
VWLISATISMSYPPYVSGRPRRVPKYSGRSRRSFGPRSTLTPSRALLALRVAPVGTRRLALELPAEPASLATLRRSLGRYLAALGVEADDAFAITVAVGEAAANAVEHAYGPAASTFSVEAIAGEDELCVTVRDRGRWRAPRGTGRGRGLTLMKELTGSAEVSHSNEGTEVRLVCPLRGAVPHR